MTQKPTEPDFIDSEEEDPPTIIYGRQYRYERLTPGHIKVSREVCGKVVTQTGKEHHKQLCLTAECRDPVTRNWVPGAVELPVEEWRQVLNDWNETLQTLAE